MTGEAEPQDVLLTSSSVGLHPPRGSEQNPCTHEAAGSQGYRSLSSTQATYRWGVILALSTLTVEGREG